MNFQEFKTNVQGWAEDRGIYAQSTPEAQLMKALSELGELADAFIKQDINGVKDGVGDVAVCLVNAITMQKRVPDWDGVGIGNLTECGIGDLASYIGESLANGWDVEFDCCMSLLHDIAGNSHFTIGECFAQAWNEIKDRKGRMVSGGAFVKDTRLS